MVGPLILQSTVGATDATLAGSTSLVNASIVAAGREAPCPEVAPHLEVALVERGSRQMDAHVACVALIGLVHRWRSFRRLRAQTFEPRQHQARHAKSDGPLQPRHLHSWCRACYLQGMGIVLRSLALALLLAAACTTFGTIDVPEPEPEAGAPASTGQVPDGVAPASDAGRDSSRPPAIGTLQLPASVDTTEGNSGNSAPFAAGGQRFQSVYGAASLTALPRGAIIKAIRFRLDSGAMKFPTQTIASFEIQLSTSARPPGSLSPTFAANRGSDAVIVRAGPLAIEPADYPSDAAPNAFGKRIDFNLGSFTYTGGPLLLEVASTTVTASRVVDNVFPSSQDTQSVYGTGFSATVADKGTFFDLIVIEYTFEYPR